MLQLWHSPKSSHHICAWLIIPEEDFHVNILGRISEYLQGAQFVEILVVFIIKALNMNVLESDRPRKRIEEL